ncbi:TRAFAC clade GTPase domain-containing protein [Clostridium thailandense]|uniref:TRAFAC clade GTPase domain-containing protein n=1 Tax=Clostridium thailandense TaxID=2794346 RepID=UPI001FEBB197|nr:hypothetical protein [Clostridium thailandense]
MGRIIASVSALFEGILGAVIGISEGFLKSFTGYFKGLSYSLHKGYSLKSKREFCEPAKENYFFYKQYEDLNNTYKSACSVNTGNILVLRQKLKEKGAFTYGRVKAEQATIHIVGNLMNIFCYFIHFLIVTFISIPGYIFYFGIAAIENLKLIRGKITGICYHCHAKFDIPYYICPECGSLHRQLKPGPYGIMRRVCKCGKVIPTTNLTGRYSLKSICPVCSRGLEVREASPICIPIIGGVSSGKTSFVYSALDCLINDVSKKNNWNISFLNGEDEERIRELLELASKGIPPRKTIKADTVPYNIFIKSGKFRSDKLLYIYDIAGEYFDIRAEVRRQSYYKYTNGLIFIIDPLCIKSSVKYITDKNEITQTVAIEDLVDRFILALREIKEVEPNEFIDIPIAIVLNKIDLINYKGAALDFLKEIEEEKIIRKFQYNFSKYKFFSCSSLQFNNRKFRGDQGVAEIISWVLAQANNEIK